MSENKTPKIVFAPGCFDNFDGTQEELDELIAEINRMVESGEIFEKSKPVDLDDESWTEEEIELLEEMLYNSEENTGKRTLN